MGLLFAAPYLNTFRGASLAHLVLGSVDEGSKECLSVQIGYIKIDAIQWLIIVERKPCRFIYLDRPHSKVDHC
jgi:hypothetical protein